MSASRRRSVAATVRAAGVALLFVLALLPSARAAAPFPGDDLAKVYPGRLEWVQYGLTWRCTPDDVWRLDRFAFEHDDALQLETGPATVVIGSHDGNALWAVVFPDEPAPLATEGLPGDGEHASTITLRFAPGAVGELFPRRTIDGHGDPWLRARADRIFRHKLGWKWYTPSGNTTVVGPGWFLVDVDTTEGPRRFYGVSRNDDRVEYVDEFTDAPVPPGTPIEADAAAAAFDQVWEAFDAEYAKFGDLPDVDWPALKEHYRPLAAEADTVFDLGAVVADMLARLRDLHVWVRADGDGLPGFTRDRPLNASWNGTRAQLESVEDFGPGLSWGRTDDGLGYVNVHGLGADDLPRRFDEVLEELGDTWGLVLDLRFNGGGSETLARQMAGRFLDAEHVYSRNRYRSGPAHGDLGEVLDRTAGPAGPWRYESPVVALWGQRTLSSAESFALMLARCPQVTTMGDVTGGSSGNPRLLELDCGLAVNLPRWRDTDPDGNPIENHGVEPEVRIELKRLVFDDAHDPVMERALKTLRKTPKRKREPGRRDG